MSSMCVAKRSGRGQYRAFDVSMLEKR